MGEGVALLRGDTLHVPHRGAACDEHIRDAAHALPQLLLPRARRARLRQREAARAAGAAAAAGAAGARAEAEAEVARVERGARSAVELVHVARDEGVHSRPQLAQVEEHLQRRAHLGLAHRLHALRERSLRAREGWRGVVRYKGECITGLRARWCLPPAAAPARPPPPPPAPGRPFAAAQPPTPPPPTPASPHLRLVADARARGLQEWRVLCGERDAAKALAAWRAADVCQQLGGLGEVQPARRRLQLRAQLGRELEPQQQRAQQLDRGVQAAQLARLERDRAVGALDLGAHAPHRGLQAAEAQRHLLRARLGVQQPPRAAQQRAVVAHDRCRERGLELAHAAAQLLRLRVRRRARPRQHAARELGGVEVGRLEGLVARQRQQRVGRGARRRGRVAGRRCTARRSGARRAAAGSLRALRLGMGRRGRQLLRAGAGALAHGGPSGCGVAQIAGARWYGGERSWSRMPSKVRLFVCGRCRAGRRAHPAPRGLPASRHRPADGGPPFASAPSRALITTGPTPPRSASSPQKSRAFPAHPPGVPPARSLRRNSPGHHGGRAEGAGQPHARAAGRGGRAPRAARCAAPAVRRGPAACRHGPPCGRRRWRGRGRHAAGDGTRSQRPRRSGLPRPAPRRPRRPGRRRNTARGLRRRPAAPPAPGVPRPSSPAPDLSPSHATTLHAPLLSRPRATPRSLPASLRRRWRPSPRRSRSTPQTTCSTATAPPPRCGRRQRQRRAASQSFPGAGRAAAGLAAAVAAGAGVPGLHWVARDVPTPDTTPTRAPQASLHRYSKALKDAKKVGGAHTAAARRPAALPPCRPAALPPCRPAALPPCRPAALPPCRPAAALPDALGRCCSGRRPHRASPRLPPVRRAEARLGQGLLPAGRGLLRPRGVGGGGQGVRGRCARGGRRNRGWRGFAIQAEAGSGRLSSGA
jgi:hypothetical protein